MHSRRQAWIKIVQIVFVGALVSGLSAQISDFRPQIGIPEDWTHHHIKFNSAAIRQHPEIASREPRAALHLYREARMAALASFQGTSATAASPHRDWSINLGTGRIQFGQYPAKWNASPFWGVTRNCSGASGCVMSMANGLVPGTTPATEIGGASGIIVDNNSTAGAASSIYFTTEQNPLNAVKLTQQGLN